MELNCILDFLNLFIDHEGYSIAAKGFLPTVVDTIIIWIKFALCINGHSCPLSLVHWFLRCWCSLLLYPAWPCPVYLDSIPGSCVILFFTASDFTSITSHIHNWAFLSLGLHLFILFGAISPLFSCSILGTYRPGEFIFQCPIFLPFHAVLWSQGKYTEDHSGMLLSLFGRVRLCATP